MCWNMLRSLTCTALFCVFFQLWLLPVGGDPTMRLVNGHNQCSGRVEVLRNGQWETVCDHYWDITDAQVVCRAMNCGPAQRATTAAFFGQGQGSIWNVHLHCSGNETSLLRCRQDNFPSGHCGHTAVAGVECSDDIPVIRTQISGQKIAVVMKKLCWSDALFYCRKYYWDLLSIRNQEDQSRLGSVLAANSSLTQHVWIGLRRDLRGSTWFWMNGAAMNYDDRQHSSVWQDTSPCGGMDTRSPFHWSDFPCDYHLHFICLEVSTGTSRVEFYSSKVKN